MRCSGSSARQLAERVLVGSAERFGKARRACGKQLRRSRRSEWRCHAGEASVGHIRFAVGSTTQHRQRELVWARRRSGPTGGAARGLGLKLGVASGGRGPVSLRERTRARRAGQAEPEVLALGSSPGEARFNPLARPKRTPLTFLVSTLRIHQTLRNRQCVTALSSRTCRWTQRENTESRRAGRTVTRSRLFTHSGNKP